MISLFGVKVFVLFIKRMKLSLCWIPTKGSQHVKALLEGMTILLLKMSLSSALVDEITIIFSLISCVYGPLPIREHSSLC